MSDLANLPAAPPPPGIIPNFIDPPTRVPTIVALEAVFLTLMLLTVAMRIYVRTRVTRVWGLEDYACIVAACGSVIHMIVYTQMFEVGYGRHIWDIRAITFTDVQKSRTLTANGIVYPVTIFFAKLATLLLYLRIFKVDRSLRFAIYFGILFQALFYTAVMGVAIGATVQCNVVVMNAAVNAATDIYVLLLPVGRVWTLQLSFKRKLGILALFGAGIMTCAASLARLIVFSINLESRDILWIQARNSELTIVEINLAIIASCASCFPSYFAKIKVVYSGLYQRLRSRIDTTDGLSNRAHTAPAQDMVTTPKKQIPGESWHSDRTKLTNDTCVELRDATSFGGVTTVMVGRNRSGSSGLDDGGTNTEEELLEGLGQEPGIVRTVHYDVENHRWV